VFTTRIEIRESLNNTANTMRNQNKNLLPDNILIPLIFSIAVAAFVFMIMFFTVNASIQPIKDYSERVEKLALTQVNIEKAPSPLTSMLKPVLPTSEASVFESVKKIDGQKVMSLSPDEREALARNTISKVSAIELDILKRQYDLDPSEKLEATIIAYPDLVILFTDSIVEDLRSRTTLAEAFQSSGIIFTFTFILCLISATNSARREKEKLAKNQ